jgi:hypothetical protein
MPKEKEKETVFTDEEMQKLAEIQNGYTNLQTQMGQTRMQQLGLEAQLNKVADVEINLSEDLVSLNAKESELAQVLNDKYGPGQLDPETGVFTPAESK